MIKLEVFSKGMGKTLFFGEGTDFVVHVMFPDGRECQLFLHEDRESWLHKVEHGEYRVWKPKGEKK